MAASRLLFEKNKAEKLKLLKAKNKEGNFDKITFLAAINANMQAYYTDDWLRLIRGEFRAFIQ